jgi:hypothetical protein
MTVRDRSGVGRGEAGEQGYAAEDGGGAAEGSEDESDRSQTGFQLGRHGEFSGAVEYFLLTKGTGDKRDTGEPPERI